MIEMIEVESSNVKSVGHDGDETLRVQFKGNGPPYDYRPVPADDFEKILSGSAGQLVNSIKGRAGVTCVKVTE